MNALIVALPLFLATGSPAPPVIIRVGPNTRVSDKSVPFVEPSIAAHPSDGRTSIVSASELVGDEGSLARVFSSNDGGATWKSSFLPRMQHVQEGGDVRSAIDTWVTYAPEGDAYLSTLGRLRLASRWTGAVLIYRLRGSAWSGPAVVTGASMDRPVIAAATKGAVYVAALASRVEGLPEHGNDEGVLVLRSVDGGQSFERTAFLVPDDLGHQAQNPLVLPSGALLVPYGDYPLRAQHRLSAARLYTTRSRDGGRTFETPRFIADIPRAFGGFFHLAVDRTSGPFAGRLYAVWNGGDIGPDVHRGARRDVSVAFSSDEGRTWSPPRTLAADDAGPAYFSAVAAASDGSVGIGWIQHDLPAETRDCYRVYFAASVDGGGTFTQPAVVSDAPSCPDNPAHSVPRSFLGGRTVFQRFARGGDYIGLAASADNAFHFVWSDAREGPFQVYSARIELRRNRPDLPTAHPTARIRCSGDERHPAILRAPRARPPG